MSDEAVEIEVSVKVKVSKQDLDDWVEWVTGGKEGYGDLFLTTHCGYWLQGVQHDPEKQRWLAWEMDELVERIDGVPVTENPAIEAFQGGCSVPDGYFILDEETAKKAYSIGLTKYGADWYADGDADTFDFVLQLTLLGEHRYA